MSDLISRQDAIDAVLELSDKLANEMLFIDAIVDEIENLPSAEPERKKGRWIEISWSEPDPNVCFTSYAFQSAKCSICGKYLTIPYLHSLDYFPYCPNCGTEMTIGDR